MTDTDVSFSGRVSFAFRILFDGVFAARVKRLMDERAAPALPPPREREVAVPEPSGVATSAPAVARVGPGSTNASKDDAALATLALLQREGRLVDFLQQSIDSFSDADVGAAARVVHAGCRRALLAHFEIVRVRDEPEGSAITLPIGFDGASVTLTGDVRGSAPYRGVLRHSGWRVRQVQLPERAPGHDATLLAPAEVEL